MTNVPPPDPDSSRLGFDELLGIVIAFATIGTILAVTLTSVDSSIPKPEIRRQAQSG